MRAYPPKKKIMGDYLLKEYLMRTSIIRKDCTHLFISYVKPHNIVCRDTISRWLKALMSKAGRDVKKFLIHSTCIRNYLIFISLTSYWRFWLVKIFLWYLHQFNSTYRRVKNCQQNVTFCLFNCEQTKFNFINIKHLLLNLQK